MRRRTRVDKRRMSGQESQSCEKKNEKKVKRKVKVKSEKKMWRRTRVDRRRENVWAGERFNHVKKTMRIKRL